MTSFLCGAQLVLLDHLFSKDVIHAVHKYAITGLAAVAATWNQLLQTPWSEEHIASLRYITNSGGAIPENYVRELRKRMPKVSIYLMYGLTEAFRSTYLEPHLVDEKPTSMGKAIPGAEILVLDENDRPVKPGEIGQLVHRGALVAQGYWGEPELTDVRFRRNPLQPREVLIPEMVVYSGDYVKMDEEGFLYFVGRKDEMIKSAGNRVSPTEVEEVLYTSGTIQDAIVMGIPHEIYGHAIKAIVVPRPGAKISTGELLAHCRRMLPPYMIPQDIEIQQELPRNANGKLDRALVKNEVLERLARKKQEN
jgi:acyl-CoA synthetase (AMP-forming)/AMP-acid ligase II